MGWSSAMRVKVSPFVKPSLENVPKARLWLTIVGFILSLIGTCMIWNVSRVNSASPDLRAAINYFIFTVWICGAVFIASVLLYSSHSRHNTAILFAMMLFSVHFVALSSLTTAHPAFDVPTSFSAMTKVY